MKNFFLSVFLFLFSLMCLSQTGITKTDVTAIVNSNNKFAFDLFSKTNPLTANMVFSPVSLASALALTAAGAAGETERQIKDVLHMPAISESVHKSFNSLLAYYNTELPGNGIQLKIANAIWLSADAKFNAAYLKLAETSYRSHLFALSNAAAINKWVAAQTNNKIITVLNDKDVAGAGLIISNVIYFKAAWKEEFDTLNTKINTFRTGNKIAADVPFMNKTIAATNYFEDKKLQVLELPYKGDSLSMLIFLPKSPLSLSAFAEGFTLQKLDSILNALEKKKIKVSIPKFKFSSAFELQKKLSALGMAAAFNPAQADFSAITPQKMHLTKLVHKAVIEVNEKGSEAAGSTNVVVGYTAVTTIPEFKADRPFTFIIKENKYNSILFMGNVINPKQ